MIYRPVSRGESPGHQQLYKPSPASTSSHRPRSGTPTRSATSQLCISRATSAHGGAARRARLSSRARSHGGQTENMVYVADVNPVYSISAAVRCIAAVNSRIMWTAEYSGAICVRALPRGTPLRELPGRTDTCCISLLYLPGEDLMWAGFQDGYLHVYEARSMALRTEVMAHSGGVHCITHVEGSVFTGGADWKISQWAIEDGSPQLRRTLHGHRGGVRSLSLYDGPTGAVLFSGSDDGTVRAWDPYISPNGSATTTAASLHAFTGHTRAVLALAVVPHANQLWSAGEDLTLRVWDMRSLECIAVLQGGHTAPIANLMLVESRIWSADKHGHILLWDVTTHSLLEDIAERMPYGGAGQGMILAMQKVQPTTLYKVWTSSSNGVLQCWNAETVPILFDEMPIAANAFKASSTAPAVMQTTTVGGTTEEGSVGGPSTSAADVVNSAALTVASVGNESEQHRHSLDAPLLRLQEELESTRRDAKLNYEKFRLEVQLEVETQQLLAQENARLRSRVRELEDRIGVPHAESPVLAQLTSSSASRHAVEEEVERLRKELLDARRQLAAALEGEQFFSSNERVSGAGTPAAAVGRRGQLAKSPSSDTDHRSSSQGNAGPPGTIGAGTVPYPWSALLTTVANETHTVGGVPLAHTRLTRSFKGGNWAYVMEEKPHELRSTFIADVCAGLGVAPTQLEVVHLSMGSLVAEVVVVHPASVPAAELERRMQTYRFPALMKLHTDAFTAPKTPPDAATATAHHLQQQLADAQLQQQQQRQRDISPDPLQPSLMSLQSSTAGEDGGVSTVERRRLKEQNETLRDTLQRQMALFEELRKELAEKEKQLEEVKLLHQRREASLEPRQSESVLAGKGSRNASYGEGPVRATESVSLLADGDTLDDFVALKNYVQDQLKPSIAQLKRERGELQFDNSELRRKADDQARQMLQLQRELAAAEASPTKVTASSATVIVSEAATSQHTKDEATDAELQQLRDDHAALQDYLHHQLKPLISRLKRACGELQLDNECLQAQLASAEQARASTSKREREKRLSNSSPSVSPSPPVPTGPAALVPTPHADRVASLAVAPTAPYKGLRPQQDDAIQPAKTANDTQQLQDDYEALRDYLHHQLKPMISHLKRSKGELQWDLAQAREELLRLRCRFEEANVALEEARVREQKMGETLETLHGTLQAEEMKEEVKESGGGFSPPLGHADLSSNTSVDRLAASNLELSIQLADAETVITQLQSALDRTTGLLASQRDETRRLQTQIQGYQEGSRPSPSVRSGVYRSSSSEHIVSSISPSKSPMRSSP